MWGRFSASTESVIDKDLGILDESNGDLDRLIAELRLSQGGLRVEPGHFHSWSVGARFYPVLYMLTRMQEARDWGSGLPLKKGLLGKMNVLEVHHIFPKARLYAADYARAEVNALANFCFLTKDTNLNIRDRRPEEYFPEIEAAHPGALRSQWVPEDPHLWKVDNFPDFVAAWKILLAEAANACLASLLHDETSILGEASHTAYPTATFLGGISGEEEERELEELNDWVAAHGFTRGQMGWNYVDPATGAQKAILDLAWEDGVQRGLTEPVAVLLNEGAELLSMANAAGFRCFTSSDAFRQYIRKLNASNAGAFAAE